MNDKKLNASEVSILVGVSVPTLNMWYRWKFENPDNKLARLLPMYQQEGGRQTRYWKEKDVAKIIEFHSQIPKGRNGILGSVTQKYVKKNRKEK